MSSPAVSQIEAVEWVMQNAGGLATLAHLYRKAPHVADSTWSGTKTPFASIRRIVQTSGRFWRVRPGLWALKSEEARLREQLELPLNAPPVSTETFDHAYYQGLLLQLGCFDGWKTTVPSQDKNRPFLGSKLRELATLEAPPPFTFDRLMRHAKTIDVGWYNEREFPQSFFEVEHSTDIQNSLLKFLEFQDLRCRFVIVADELRRPEWNDKMSRAAFRPLRDRVDFLPYETLANRHALAAQKAVLEST